MNKEAVHPKKIKLINSILSKSIKNKKRAHDAVATGTDIVKVNKPKTIAPINNTTSRNIPATTNKSLVPSKKPTLTPKITSNAPKVEGTPTPRQRNRKKDYIDAEYSDIKNSTPLAPENVIGATTVKQPEVRERWERIINSTPTPIRTSQNTTNVTNNTYNTLNKGDTISNSTTSTASATSTTTSKANVPSVIPGKSDKTLKWILGGTAGGGALYAMDNKTASLPISADKPSKKGFLTGLFKKN